MVRSELIKLRGLVSTVVLTVLAVVSLVGLGSLAAWALGGGARAGRTVSAATLTESVSAGEIPAALFLGSLAAAFVGAEWASGSITTSLIALPDRWMWLRAKAIVCGLGAFLVTAAGGLAASVAAVPLLSGAVRVAGPLAPGTPFHLFAMGVFAAVTTVLAVGLAAATRSTTGGILSLVTLLLVAPLVLTLVPYRPLGDVVPYLPLGAGNEWMAAAPAPGGLGRQNSLLVLLGWAGAALWAGRRRLERSDI